jgi:hypothetical protein
VSVGTSIQALAIHAKPSTGISQRRVPRRDDGERPLRDELAQCGTPTTSIGTR